MCACKHTVNTLLLVVFTACKHTVNTLLLVVFTACKHTVNTLLLIPNMPCTPDYELQSFGHICGLILHKHRIYATHTYIHCIHTHIHTRTYNTLSFTHPYIDINAYIHTYIDTHIHKHTVNTLSLIPSIACT